jgi:hypothetical protein
MRLLETRNRNVPKLYRFKNQKDGSIYEIKEYSIVDALSKARKWFKTTLVVALMR